MKKINGLLHLNSGTLSIAMLFVLITTAVAAAASVPSSFTSTIALWITFEINKSLSIPVKSALFPKASGAPKSERDFES